MCIRDRLIPIRRVSLVVEEPVMVIPGGHSIGVILRSQGVVVTGFAPVETIDGRQVWPAKNSGAEVGDVILSVGDRKIRGKEDLSLAVDAAGRAGQWLDILFEKPDGSVSRKVIMPVQHKDGGYRLGLLVKEDVYKRQLLLTGLIEPAFSFRQTQVNRLCLFTR